MEKTRKDKVVEEEIRKSVEKVNIVLDASMIDLFETCPARYNFRYNHNRTLPPPQKAKSLDLGSLAHRGFEVYFKMLKDGHKFTDRIEACKLKIVEVASNIDESNVDDDDVRDLVKAIESSCDFWREEDENCLEILAVENPFAYILYEDDEIRFIITGIIDLLVNYHGIGRNQSYDNLPIDHKTFSRDGIVLRKTNQFINYACATESNYLVVNRIGLGYKDTTRNPKPIDQRFQRPPLSYDPIYKQDWKDNLVKMLKQEYLPALADNEWVEKPTSCNKFNRLCEYYEICDSSGQSSKDFKLNDVYVLATPWDVSKPLGVTE